jgi:hypothetical protein
MAIHITLEWAKKAVEGAMKERGADFVYEKPNAAKECLYVHADNTPGCIVGLVLHNAGVPLSTLAKYEGTAARALIICLLDEQVVDSADSEALYFLDALQMHQDDTTPWGDAYSNAVEGASDAVENIPE